jgi:hypothetical protein
MWLPPLLLPLLPILPFFHPGWLRGLHPFGILVGSDVPELVPTWHQRPAAAATPIRAIKEGMIQTTNLSALNEHTPMWKLQRKGHHDLQGSHLPASLPGNPGQIRAFMLASRVSLWLSRNSSGSSFRQTHPAVLTSSSTSHSWSSGSCSPGGSSRSTCIRTTTG